MQGKNKSLVISKSKPPKFFERESVDIKLNIPKDVVESLEKIAKKKDLSVESVLKFFIGQGLRKELGPKETTELARKRLKSIRGLTESTDLDLAA